MSAPDTNIETQERRHAPALIGIKGAMIFGALMIVILGFIVVSNSSPDEAVGIVEKDEAAAATSVTLGD